MMNTAELSTRMQALANEIGNLPNTGMVEATRALAITSEALTVLMAVVDEADQVIARVAGDSLRSNGRNRPDMKIIRPC